MDNSHSNPVLNWVSQRKFGIEITLSLISILVYVGAATDVLHDDLIVIITLLTLSGFYFLSAFFLIDVPSLGALIGSKLVGVSSAVCTVGVTFALLGFFGAKNQLMIGLLPLVPSTIVVIATLFVSPRKDLILLAVRGILISFISLWHFTQPGLK